MSSCFEEEEKNKAKMIGSRLIRFEAILAPQQNYSVSFFAYLACVRFLNNNEVRNFRRMSIHRHCSLFNKVVASFGSICHLWADSYSVLVNITKKLRTKMILNFCGVVDSKADAMLKIQRSKWLFWLMARIEKVSSSSLSLSFAAQ